MNKFTKLAAVLVALLAAAPAFAEDSGGGGSSGSSALEPLKANVMPERGPSPVIRAIHNLMRDPATASRTRDMIAGIHAARKFGHQADLNVLLETIKGDQAIKPLLDETYKTP